MEKAVRIGDIAGSTWNKLKRMSGNRKSRRAGTIHEQKRSKLCLIYDVPMDGVDDLLVQLFLTSCIARECLRLGIDPVRTQLTWLSGRFPIKTFYHLLLAKNHAVPRSPSMHQALFGSDEHGTDSLHWHDLQLRHDDWYKRVFLLVNQWVTWNVPKEVQVQLISFANAFNGKSVTAALEEVEAPQMLPIQPGDLLPNMWSRMASFLSQILQAGHNVYCIRYGSA